MATELIGKGAFTKAYLLDSGRVLLKSCDPIKECMALGFFPEHRLFPKMEMIECGMYEMEYYPRVNSLKNNLDAEEYKLYKTLREIAQSITNPLNIYDSYSVLYKAFEESNLNDEVKEVMIEALDGCSNFGPDIGFEISPRNVAVKDGKLVLLDVFFSKSVLKKVRS